MAPGPPPITTWLWSAYAMTPPPPEIVGTRPALIDPELIFILVVSSMLALGLVVFDADEGANLCRLYLRVNTIFITTASDKAQNT